jgi:hypothetical protein
MVSPTTEKAVFQIGFYIETEPMVQVEVCCYVVPTRAGRMHIYYHEHVWHERAVPNGPWNLRTRARLELTEALKAQIRTNVALELCKYGGMDVSVLAYPHAGVHSKEEMVGEAFLKGLTV